MKKLLLSKVLTIVSMLFIGFNAYAEDQKLLEYTFSTQDLTTGTYTAGNGTIEVKKAATETTTGSNVYMVALDKGTSKCLGLTLAEGETFKAGDVISFNANTTAGTPSATKQMGLVLCTQLESSGDTYSSIAGGYANLSKKTDREDISYVVESSSSLIGLRTIYVYRQSSGTVNVYSVSITRPAPAEESAASISAISADKESVETGNDIEITATVAGDPAPTIAWYSCDESGENASVVEGATTNKLTVNKLIAGTYYYYCTATNTTTADGETTATSDVVSVEFTPAPASITASDASVKATKAGEAATKDIAIAGSNLTGSTLTATLSPAVDGLSVSLASDVILEGAIETTATISYTATENASGTTTLTLSDGTTSKDVTISYIASVVAHELADVTGSTTWDWSKTGEANIQLADDTTPSKADKFVLADVIDVNENFNSEALEVQTEYAVRDSKFFQGGYVKFHTTVPGTVKVSFSNTNNRTGDELNRYCNINGNNTVFASLVSSSFTTTSAIPVAAGDVEIKGVLKGDGTDQYIRISKIEFVAASSADITKTIGTNGYSTYCSDYAFNVTGAEAYKATLSGETVSLAKIEGAIPAGVGVILKGEERANATISPATEAAAAVQDNALVGVASNTTALKTTGTNYVLSSNGTQTAFVKMADGKTVADMMNKAYLNIPASSAKSVIYFADETTGINSVATVSADAQARKAIVNGRLMIVTANGMYTPAGALVK